MPFAVLKSIREVSSEDKQHCAANLLKNDPAKKWKTGEPGEKSAYVIIEMESAYFIKGIDIGNESSAFVEVLVGGPGCARENFKEILITCSFMTPTESRTCSIPNRVRCFHREALVKEVADEKWKLLKIICTQPFNREAKYGLSFIKIHVEEPPQKTKTASSSSCASNTSVADGSVGGFTLREDSPDSETESKSALFNRWKVSKNKELNGISSVPRNPSLAAIKKPNESFRLKKTSSVATTPSAKEDDPEERPVVHDRNRSSLLFTDDDDDNSEQDRRKKKLEKLEKAIAADQERVTKETEKSKKPKKHDSSRTENKHEEKPKKDEINKPHSEKERPSHSPKSAKKPSTPSTSAQRRPSSSPCVSDKPKKPKLDKPVQYKPFHRLLEGVVLVISGIQNPDRANLRNMALALGAKYKGDWDSISTHLICAFKNTPKYNQVKGVGKIVTRNWIEDCHSKKRKFSWRRYALDSSEQTKPESEDEILDESLKPPVEQSEPVNSRKNSEDSDDVREIYDNNGTNHSQFISSGSDTDDDIQKVLATKSPKKKPTQTIDVFEVSTEEEDYVSNRKLTVPDKTTFFKKFKFFLSDQLSATDKIKLKLYIETFKGVLTSVIEEADYFISKNRIADVGEFRGETVKPLWIFECNDAECLLPTKRYLVQE